MDWREIVTEPLADVSVGKYMLSQKSFCELVDILAAQREKEYRIMDALDGLFEIDGFFQLTDAISEAVLVVLECEMHDLSSERWESTVAWWLYELPGRGPISEYGFVLVDDEKVWVRTAEELYVYLAERIKEINDEASN